MNRATWTLASILALPVLSQGAPSSSWTSVRDIPLGTRVSVSIANADRPARGTLVSVSEETVVLQEEKALLTVQRESVSRVGVFIPPSDRSKAWIAVGGAGFAALVLPSSAPGTGREPGDEGIFALLGAAIIVPVSLMAFHLTKWKTVYRTP